MNGLAPYASPPSPLPRRAHTGWRRIRAARSHPLATAVACALASALLVASVPARAGADVFGPIGLASEGSLGGGAPEQAEYAHDAAISGNGRYVAFDGSFGGPTGVWRHDLATGAIEQVAGGDAELPSISDSGRYISFTSTEDLVPEDDPSGPNVWVRDMDPGPGEPEYILASAVDGSSKGLTYEYAEPEREEPQFGSVAIGRSALGENSHGELVVAFVTTAVSNLVRYPQKEKEEEEKGETPKPHTPKLQVAVRYLGTEETMLVSGTYDPAEGQTTDEPVADEGYGAVYPGAGLGFGPVPANARWREAPPPGASISADGSTVAWLGEDVGEQVRMLSEETPSPLYTEPLWRRIAPGSQTPTERVTGGSEPGNPACVSSGEIALPPLEAQSPTDPCQGPFRVQLAAQNQSRGVWASPNGGESDFVPRLSADGYTVAFVASALPVGIGIGFGEEYAEHADLYVANMHPGLTRAQALTPVTAIAGVGDAAAEPITDFDISSDGEQVAFTTRRTDFPLGSPAFVSTPAATPGESELFDADLGDDTLTRVTHGYEEGPSFQPHGSLLQCGGGNDEDVYCENYTEGAQSPSFSDGSLIAFSSTASNLVFGDGNTPPAGPFDGSDAFVVERETFSSLPTPQYVSPAPQPPLAPAWSLGVTALSRHDGSVLLYVQTPGAGAVRAGAQSSVVVESDRAAHSARHARPSASHARATAEGEAEADEVRAVATRTVATRTANADGAGLTTLTLPLPPRYAALARARGGLSAMVTVTFTAAGHHTLHDSIPVTFVRKVKRSKAHPRKKARNGSSSRADRKK